MTGLESARNLVEADWLRENLGREDLAVLDCSWHMAHLGRDAEAEFVQAHIPGARFFDFDRRIAAPGTDVPHMLPDAARFEREVRALGIGNDTDVVCYDTLGIMTAPRGWWMFRAFGHRRVAVLNGGLPAWQAVEGDVESGEPASAAPGDFDAHFEPGWVRDVDAVRAALDGADELVLDARSRGRYRGEEPEPRAGLRGGHMPGALNLPFPSLLEAGRFRDDAALAAAFETAGAAREAGLVMSCGSGVTACILALAAERAGYPRIAVYDGSWSEWGAREDTPVVEGG